MPSTPVSLLVRLRKPGDNPKDQATWRLSWDRFVELYTPLIHCWACRRVDSNHGDAADLMQDVFVKLLEAVPRFEYDPEKKNFRGWLCKLIDNRWRELRRQRSEKLLADGSDPDLDNWPADDEPATFEEAEYCQYVAGRAWELVRDEYEVSTQNVFDLVVRGNQPVAEVALKLNMTPAAIYKAKSRVLQRLREEFAHFLD